MNDLIKMPNIGSVLAERMAEADITTVQKLREIGAKTAFVRVKTVYPDACINHLYAIEGAIQNIRWHNLSQHAKQELRNFYNTIK